MVGAIAGGSGKVLHGGGDGMNILLWVLQVLLGLAFFAHGWLLLFPPAAVVDQMNAWVRSARRRAEPPQQVIRALVSLRRSGAAGLLGLGELLEDGPVCASEMYASVML
jgi:uncharacterized membrane protein YphA (DoxX/SURF4 family)